MLGKRGRRLVGDNSGSADVAELVERADDGGIADVTDLADGRPR
jgi:hypothetical protein